MLQRAARNAYSWWWASHIRTKQSKWLEQSLHDMEEKVVETLRVLDDDGDSFAKRAEMYYQKRPELVEFVEESFRAYRALAERYDHLSKELQSANRTIATAFPDQVQYPMDEDYEESGPGTTSSPANDPNNQASQSLKPGIPKVPKIPKTDFRSPSLLLSRKGPLKRLASSARPVTTTISGLSKAEALAEIDNLQKETLALQTEKEFVRSLFERAYEKYREIEDQITGLEKRVGGLQDEFGVGTVIEDNDARALMAATALKSCQETLSKLQKMQAQSSEEAKVEYMRVKEAHEKFETLRDQFISKHTSQLDQDDGEKSESTAAEQRSIDEEKASLEQEEHDVGLLREKIREQLEEDSSNSLTVTEMAERIDELVNKVVALETSVSSQAGLVRRLRSETDELQTNIRSLEEDKEMLIEDSDKTKKKLKELEEELRRVKNLNRSIKCQDNSLQTHFTEASCNLEHLSERLQNVKLDIEEAENIVLNEQKKSAPDGKPGKESDERGDKLHTDNSAILKDAKTTEEKESDAANLTGDVRNEDNKSNLSESIDNTPEKIQKLLQQDRDDLSETVSNLDLESQDCGISEEEDQPNWRQLFINGLDDREKLLLEEYTSVLRNYKDVRMKLNDVEKKNRDSIFELTLQLRELKAALATRDKEIHSLHQRVISPETNPDESPYTPLTECKYTPREGLLQIAQDTDMSTSNVEARGSRTSFADLMEITDNMAMSPGISKLSPSSINEDKRKALSTLEKRFRSDIDGLLEENLEFWLRFSTSVHQIQKFQNSLQDLQAELVQIKNKNRPEGNSSLKQHSMQSEIRPIFRHMREIRTELSLWLEHNSVLQDELQGRYTSLCNIQDEIASAAHSDPKAEKSELSRYRAAKFQGEVLNMKQENSKVASELQAGLSLVKRLKSEVEKTLTELDQEFGINNQPHKQSATGSRARIPLRSFLFGVKLKRQRQSLFSCVSPSLQKQYSDLADADNLPI